MIGNWMNGIREIENHRMTIAIVVPLLGCALAAAASVLTPRGKAKGLITGAYMLLASLGAACLVFAMVALIGGQPREVFMPLFVPGVVLTAVMGLFSPEIIRSYQKFEGRKLAAELFRRG